jgi:hypothetical protein
MRRTEEEWQAYDEETGRRVSRETKRSSPVEKQMGISTGTRSRGITGNHMNRPGGSTTTRADAQKSPHHTEYKSNAVRTNAIQNATNRYSTPLNQRTETPRTISAGSRARRVLAASGSGELASSGGDAVHERHCGLYRASVLCRVCTCVCVCVGALLCGCKIGNTSCRTARGARPRASAQKNTAEISFL